MQLGKIKITCLPCARFELELALPTNDEFHLTALPTSGGSQLRKKSAVDQERGGGSLKIRQEMRKLDSKPTLWPQADLWISGHIHFSTYGVKQDVGYEPTCVFPTPPGLEEAICLWRIGSHEGLPSSTWGRSLACFSAKDLPCSLRPEINQIYATLMRVSFSYCQNEIACSCLLIQESFGLALITEGVNTHLLFWLLGIFVNYLLDARRRGKPI